MIPSEESGLPDPGEVPVLDWIDKSLIDADPLYQRPLDTNRVDGILRAFSWRSFGALVIVPAQDGRYHATDGQHRLEAAKRHPRVQFVPAVIVKADDVPAEASIFVEINKNRKNVTPLELFFAQLAAGDDGALAVQQVCQTAGVRIPKHPGNFKANDCVAVNALSNLVAQAGQSRAVDFLGVLVGAGFAPIKAEHVKAVHLLLTDGEFCGWIDRDELAKTIKSIGGTVDVEAKRFAATHCTSMWKGIANVWFQKTRKRRAPATASPAAPAPRPKGVPTDLTGMLRPEIARKAAEVAVRRTIVPHPSLPTQRNVTASIMGDPPAGRSALDQRKASA